MLKIRLSRIGKKHQPIYRVVVCESQVKQGGKVIEEIGRYSPLEKDKKVEIKKDRYEYWVLKGARPSQTIRHLANK